MLNTLGRLQVLGLAPMPLTEARQDSDVVSELPTRFLLEGISSSFCESPIAIIIPFTGTPNLEHLANGPNEYVLKRLHDLSTSHYLDTAPFLYESVDSPDCVEKDCSRGRRRLSGSRI